MQTAPGQPRRLTIQTLLLCLLGGALLACTFPSMVLALLQEPTITPTPSDTSTVTDTASPSPSPSATQSPMPGTLAPATLTLTPTNTPPTPQQGAIVYTPIAALGAPNLINPNNVAIKMRPYYEWSPVVNASLYTIWVWQLDQNGQKRELVVNEQHRALDICSPSLCQIRPDVQLVDTKQYTWVVQAYGSPGYSPFSAQLTFTAAKMTVTPGPSIYCPLAYSGKFGGGTVNAVAVAPKSGSPTDYYAYIGDGNILRVIQVTISGSTASFDELGKLSLNSTINGIAIKNDYISGDPRYIYIADGSAGIRIVDVSSTSAPAQVGAYTTANDARKVVYKNFTTTDPILFVADGSNGVKVLSVNDAQNPTLISSADTPGTAKDLDIFYDSGNTIAYVYVADYTQGLRYFTYKGNTLSEKGGDNSYIKYANSVAFESSSIGSPLKDTIMVADNSMGVVRAYIDPAPAPIPTIAPNPTYTPIGSQFAAIDVKKEGSYFYAIGGNQFVIIEKDDGVKYPPSPSPTPIIYDARNVTINNTYAFIADGAYGLKVIDISSPTAPSLIGTHDASIVAYDVVTSGGYAFVTDYNGRLVRLDLSTPNAPALSGSANLPNTSPKGNPYAVAIDSGNAYVANNDGDLRWIELNAFTPLNDVTLKCHDSGGACPGTNVCNGGFAKDITVPGDGWIYLACNDQGVAKGTSPSSSFNPPYPVSGLANGLAISGSNIYVAAYQKGLQILNSSGGFVAAYPSGSDTVPGNYHAVGRFSRYAFAVADTAGLQVINLATPGAPQLESSLDTPGNAVNITILDTTAFIADSGSGIEVIDIGNPTYPKTLCSYNTEGIARSVAISGKYVYVADDSNGLVVLQMPMTPTPKP